jgi:hypothetical protein
MGAFLDELAKTQSVAQAARSVGMSRQSAYRLRRRIPRSLFVEAWDFAIAAPPGALAGRVASPCHPVTFSQATRWNRRKGKVTLWATRDALCRPFVALCAATIALWRGAAFAL